MASQPYRHCLESNVDQGPGVWCGCDISVDFLLLLQNISSLQMHPLSQRASPHLLTERASQGEVAGNTQLTRLCWDLAWQEPYQSPGHGKPFD